MFKNILQKKKGEITVFVPVFFTYFQNMELD
jgi:hypothetical protein